MTDDQQPVVDSTGIEKREPTTREDESNQNQIAAYRRAILKAAGVTGAGLAGFGAFSDNAAAAPGDLLGEVELPNHSAGVGLTFDGTFVYTIDGLAADVLQIYSPPAGGDGTATQEAEKNVVDGSGNPVTLSAVEWDPTRGQFWGAYNQANAVYLIDIDDPTDPGQDAVATFQFAPDTGGSSLTDGLAFDARDDTLWYTPDVSDDVWHFQPDGTLIKTITPKNEAGDTAGLISGVAMGADQNGRPTLFVGRNGASEIIRVFADDGAFIESFADLPFRVEDLACDPVTYDSEAILTKDAFDGFYVAFEVQPDTCPIAGGGCDSSVAMDLIADGGSEETAVTIGTVTVTSLDADDDDDSELSVTYSLDDDWFLRETHLHVAGDDDEDGAGDCDRIPQNRRGNPKVGQFALSRDYGSGVQEDTYVIERDAAGNVFGEKFSEGEALCVAAHAAVFQDMDGDEVFDEDEDREETAWGDGKRFVDRGNWAMHFDYQNPCVENPFPGE